MLVKFLGKSQTFASCAKATDLLFIFFYFFLEYRDMFPSSWDTEMFLLKLLRK